MIEERLIAERLIVGRLIAEPLIAERFMDTSKNADFTGIRVILLDLSPNSFVGKLFQYNKVLKYFAALQKYLHLPAKVIL